MPAPIVLRNLTPETKIVPNPPAGQPVIATKAELRDGSRGAAPQPTPVGVLFQDSFDDQPDWHNLMYTLEQSQNVAGGDTLPVGYQFLYMEDRYNPEAGDLDKGRSIEILAANADRARGGTGKSAVFHRESHDRGFNNFASDAQLVSVLDSDYDELYAEFWIRFSPNWFQRTGTGAWQSKMFRFGSWSRIGSPLNGAAGEVGPRFIWDYKRDDFGVRNLMGMLEGPHGSTAYVSHPRNGSLNYTTSTAGQGVGGSDPQIPNLVDGGFLIDLGGAPTTHEQIFGTTDVWTKMAFYVKMNSAPGVADGVLMQWINDEQFNNTRDIPWVTDDPATNPNLEMVKWNYFAIGGNDYFQAYPNEDKFEDWWAMDDLVVRDSIPESLL